VGFDALVLFLPGGDEQESAVNIEVELLVVYPSCILVMQSFLS
jgi:hypothetical protein